MTYAYDKICLERAADTLGRMIDHSVYSLHYDIAAIMDLFTASGTASLFEHGDIRTIAGMSGVELSYEVLEKSGIIYERKQPRYTKSLSPEYWCGQVLARIQWETCLSFDMLLKQFSVSAFISGYGKSRLSLLDSLPLTISGEEKTAELKAFGRRFTEEAAANFISASVLDEDAAENKETPLKKIRKSNGLSQSGLAKASGVPLRTIQQYEQRQKDISKARAEYLIALSRALNCDPAHLLSK